MLSLHTNAAALSTQNALGANNKSLTSSMTKLGTGFRINSAMDDASGLQIANRLKAQNSGMSVAMRNTQNAVSVMQTAEGALNEVNTMLVRMKDLATQSADASASAADKEANQAEYDTLAAEISNILGNTTFGGEKLMNIKPSGAAATSAGHEIAALTKAIGSAGDAAGASLTGALEAANTALDTARDAWAVDNDSKANKTLTKAYMDAQTAVEAATTALNKATTQKTKLEAYNTALGTASGANAPEGKFAAKLSFQIGATGSEVMELDLSSQLKQLHTSLTGVSSNYTSAGLSAGATGTELTGNANAMIDKLQGVLDNVGEMRSALGAASNRLQHTNSNLGNMSATTSAAIGRIMDVDYATETSAMTKNQMLMQASSSMLKQSNSMSQMVASLLQ